MQRLSNHFILIISLMVATFFTGCDMNSKQECRRMASHQQRNAPLDQVVVDGQCR